MEIVVTNVHLLRGGVRLCCEVTFGLLLCQDSHRLKSLKAFAAPKCDSQHWEVKALASW